MKPAAIVYASNTGHTARYAGLLAEATGLPAYSQKQAKAVLARGTPVIYLGWLFASTIKGYGRAARRYEICAVAGVGLCATGALTDEVRRASRLPDAAPLFTMQGGMDRAALKGVHKLVIHMLAKSLAAKSGRSDEENRMLSLLENGGDFVSRKNLSAVLNWYRAMK